MDKINSPTTTIPGIDSVLGAVIITGFGDINRFDKHSQLVAYAALMQQFLNLVNMKVLTM